jgi:phage-related minor tail protein
MSNIGYATLQIIPSMKGLSSSLAGELGGSGFKDAGKQAGSDASSSFESAFSSGMKIAGTAGVAVVATAIAAFTGFAKLGESFDSAFDTIRTSTGKTGDDLAGLEDAFKTTFASAPVSMDDTATAISGLNQRLGLTGQPLSDLSTQFLNLSRVTGTDLTSSISSITRVFGDWGVATGDQSSTMDEIFRASQATGTSIDTLTGSVVQFGAPLRQMGFSFEDSLALIGKFDKEGVNSELVLGSMRQALGKMAKAGEPTQETFSRVVESIKNAGSTSEANAKSMELFGARAGPDMAAAIREGKFDIDGLFQQISGGSDTINQAASDTDDWREKLKVLGNKAMVALEPLATKVFGAIGTAIEWATPYLITFASWISDVLPKAFNWARTALDFFIGGLTGEFTNEGSGILLFFNQFGMKLGTVVDVARGVVDWFVAQWPKVRNVIGIVVDWLVGTAWPFLQRVFTGITAAAGWVAAMFQREWPKIRAVLATVFDWLVQTAWPAVKRVFAAIVSALPSIGAGIATAFGWVMDHKEVLVGALTAVAVGILSIVVPAFVAWAAATWASAAAMIAAAAPVIAIGVAITALVAGVIHAYNHFQTFHDVVDSVVSWITGTAWPAIQAFAVGIVDGFKAVVDWTRKHWDQIQSVIDGVISAITSIVQGGIDLVVGFWHTFGDDIQTYIGAVWTAVSGVFQGFVDGIVGIFDIFKGIFTGDWEGAWNGVKEFIGGIWTAISSALSGTLTTIEATLSAAWTVISGLVTTTWDGIKSTISGVWDGIVNIVSGIKSRIVDAALDMWSDITGAVVTMKDNVTGFFDDVVVFVEGLPDKITTAAVGMWDGIKDAFKSALNWIIGKWNSLSFTLPSIDLGPLGSIGGGTFSVPQIPLFARGTKNFPGIGIVGDDGPELLIGHRGDEILSNRDSQALLNTPTMTGQQDGASTAMQAAGRGPLVGTVVMQSDRSLNDELRLVDALYGRAR